MSMVNCFKIVLMRPYNRNKKYVSFNINLPWDIVGECETAVSACIWYRKRDKVGESTSVSWTARATGGEQM